jgi:polyhydroxyalkanoate synthase subunit PhaC
MTSKSKRGAPKGCNDIGPEKAVTTRGRSKHDPMSEDRPDLAAQAAEEVLGPNPFIGLSPVDILRTLGEIGSAALRTPAQAATHEVALARTLFSILIGEAEIAPLKGDRRFTDHAWTNNRFYRMSMQAYLAWSNAIDGFIGGIGLDNAAQQRARFVASLLTDAVAPTNTLIGNPAALKNVIDSGGKSLVDGVRHLLNDLTSNRGMPAQVDQSAFDVGRNLALSPGAVVWRDEVLELNQYAPATQTVHVRPQLIVPPQINKYYVFDLAPGKSIVEFLVNSGFQTFVVSWRNPTAAHRDWNMDTYVASLLGAIDAIRDITGCQDVNLHGACSGAMTVAALLGHLAAKRRKPVHAVSLMVAVLDTEADSLLGVFATPETIAAAKISSQIKGVLDGNEMGRVFSWMRPNDLVWNYWVNNYLMGNPPPAFDVLYWNNDTTRLPAAFHGQLLDIFGSKLLHKPGGLNVLGTPVDLSGVDCDKFVLAGVTDHITPWKGVFRTARLFGGDTEFVLSSSGHVQSLVNPPGNPKARYFSGDEPSGSPEAWLSTAREVQGSWWDLWREWIAARSGEMRPALDNLGNDRHPPVAAAPGTYVREA